MGGGHEGISDGELGMRREHAIGQEIAQPRSRPALDDELRDEVQVGAWVTSWAMQGNVSPHPVLT